jgi:LysM repeat protein
VRPSRLLVLAPLGAVCLGAGPAAAHSPHVVGPGETLWGIASSHNFTTRSFAAANGLSPDAHVILGSTLRIPTVEEARSALTAAPAPTSPPGGATPASPPGSYTVQPGESFNSIAARHGTSAAQLAAVNGLDPARPLIVGTVLKTAGPVTSPTPSPSSGAPAPLGSYTVRAGESLGAIAGRSGMSVAQLAGANGLDPARPLLVGTVLKLPPGAPRPATPAPAATRVPAAPPYATPGHTTAEEVREVAAAHPSVPPSLAAAVAWQESGFNNGAVSSANARGVMQILPGTWQWVQQNLTREQLDPSSPRDNVHAGVLYLQQLLRDTGGDVPTAVASYYQGLSSVRRIGMLPETRRYVDNVMALRGRFGG